jgi:hypothetical protein
LNPELDILNGHLADTVTTHHDVATTELETSTIILRERRERRGFVRGFVDESPTCSSPLHPRDVALDEEEYRDEQQRARN